MANNLIYVTESATGSSVAFKPSEFVSAYIVSVPAEGIYTAATPEVHPVVLIHTISNVPPIPTATSDAAGSSSQLERNLGLFYTVLGVFAGGDSAVFRSSGILTLGYPTFDGTTTTAMTMADATTALNDVYTAVDTYFSSL